ncbi:MAG: hypothetical protein IPL88_11015 [Rhizobiales bacterium]|nr:hypothetical protein [Hyphomicrobiales bacterium]
MTRAPFLSPGPALAAALLALSLGGCVGGSETPQAAAPPAAAAPTGKPEISGALAGLTQGVDAADRDAALNAQIAALDAGQRKTWRGPKGSFGFVEPGSEQANCRDYAHTIYVAGRPRSAKGQACRDAATGWRFAS